MNAGMDVGDPGSKPTPEKRLPVSAESEEKAGGPPNAEANQEVRLAEYAHLHSEKSQRAALQQALLALNLTVSGVLVGLVIDNGQNLELLLVLSVTSPLFGLMWINHHVNIHRVAEYMQTELWAWDPSWEAWIREDEHEHPVWWSWVVQGATFLSFAAVAFAALAVGWPFDAGSQHNWWPIFALGAFLLTLFSISFWRLALKGRPKVTKT